MNLVSMSSSIIYIMCIKARVFAIIQQAKFH